MAEKLRQDAGRSLGLGEPVKAKELDLDEVIARVNGKHWAEGSSIEQNDLDLKHDRKRHLIRRVFEHFIGDYCSTCPAGSRLTTLHVGYLLDADVYSDQLNKYVEIAIIIDDRDTEHDIRRRLADACGIHIRHQRTPNNAPSSETMAKFHRHTAEIQSKPAEKPITLKNIAPGITVNLNPNGSVTWAKDSDYPPK